MLCMFQEDRNFHDPIITPALDTQTPLWGCNGHLQKNVNRKQTGISNRRLFCFPLVIQEVRDWQLVRPKLRPEQRIQMNLGGALPCPKQKNKKLQEANHVTDQGRRLTSSLGGESG